MKAIAQHTLSTTDKRPWLDRMAKKVVLSKLQKLQQGELKLVDGDEVFIFGSFDESFPVKATIHVLNSQFYSDIAFGGSIGAGESYTKGDCEINELTNVVRILLRNYDVLENLEKSTAWLTVPLHKLFHWLHRNTRRGSRRNIAAHYDLGNEMFELFLDETMMYSCGIFEHPKASLTEASLAKIKKICQKLQLKPDDHVVEIGTGWGGFAIYAARHYGCRVTTTTISPAQYKLAVQRIEKAGLSDRITVLCQDYRELSGQYDKLVSIEMIEAIGYSHFDSYFDTCSRLLKDDGMMLLQSITITDQRYETAKRSVDFIQRYIFPGGCLPSVSVLTDSVARQTDMRLFHLDDIGPHYAKTLRLWRQRFFANLEQIKKLGYADHFVRLWDYYLCYCEGGFMERALGTVQMLLTKPLCRREPVISNMRLDNLQEQAA